MAIHSLNGRKTVIVCLTLTVSMCLIGIVAAKRQQIQPPRVLSKVKHLEVRNVTIQGEGEPGAFAAIDIFNDSDNPIIAIAIESGDDKDASGISTDGFQKGDEPPSVILPPYGTITMRFPLNNLHSGKPLKVAAVIYADGKADGEDLAKNTLRGHKEKAKKH